MSILKRRWHFYERNEALAAELSGEFNITSFTSQVLINRGLKTSEQVYDFLNPKLSSLRNPSEIPNMESAVSRVLEARRDGQKIMVYGDYDADGVTGTSIMVLGLKKLGLDADYYIPHRYDEGYGMNRGAIKKIAGKGVKLLITVDCGVSNYKEVEYCSSLGIDVIITDHHNLPEKLPPACAVINPKQIEGPHPSRDLSGAGVAFKFVWALFKAAGITDTSTVKDFLDLAALGTVADVVPLTGENRTIAVAGIRVLNEKKRVGMKHLFEAAGLSGEANAKKVSFMLAPRLNAPGRLKHAELSIKLLLEDDPSKAQDIAAEINTINRERQQIGSLIGDEAFLKLGDLDGRNLILLAGKNWHPGVIGIVASKIAERFHRPTVLISEEKGRCRGSVRSIEGFDVFKLLGTCRDLFTDFGGHRDAAGFEMPSSNLRQLEERLSKEASQSLAIDSLVPRTRVDLEVPADHVNLKLACELASLEPFGQGNPVPVLMSRRLDLVSRRKVGAKGNHLKVKLSDGGNVFDCIGFGMGSLSDNFEGLGSVDAAYNLTVNEWNGAENAQMELVDIRRAQS